MGVNGNNWMWQKLTLNNVICVFTFTLLYNLCPFCYIQCWWWCLFLASFFLQSLRKIGKEKLILLLSVAVLLSYLPEAGEYASFFVYLRLVSICVTNSFVELYSILKIMDEGFSVISFNLPVMWFLHWLCVICWHIFLKLKNMDCKM